MCEIVEMEITKLSCPDRSDDNRDWCDVCRNNWPRL